MKKPSRLLSLTVLLTFCVFIYQSMSFARRPPNRINLKIKMQAKIKWKQERGRIIPQELVIRGRSYPFVKQSGKWGIQAPLRQIMRSSPECRDAVHLAVGEIALTRIRDLVGGDRAEAQKLVKDLRDMKRREPAGEALSPSHGPSDGGLDYKAVPIASSSGDVTQSSMQGAYNTMLNSSAFLYPQPQPGIGGWDVVSEEGTSGGEEESGGAAGSESGDVEDEGGGFFSWLATVIFVLVVIFAPIVAACWLAATAITLATVTLAFLGSLGAVTAAGLVGTVLNVVDDVVPGQPLIEIYNSP